MGGFDFGGLSGLLTAGTAMLGAYAATYKATTGKRREQRQQEAATALTADDQTNRHYRDLIADLNLQSDRKDAEINRLQDEISEARVQITKERLEHRGEMSHMRDIVATLRDVVHSEIAQFIADDGINGSPPAVAIEHTPAPEDPHVQ